MKHTSLVRAAFARFLRGTSCSAATSAFLLLLGAPAIHAQPVHGEPGRLQPDPAAFTVGADAPADIPGGADKATVAQAAIFAWQHFITLNWPAVPQTGQPNTRGVRDTSARFGDQSKPLVWHTFRSKVEVFTATPPGTTFNSSTNSLQFNFDAAPAYPYENPVTSGQQPAPTSTAWINLDETSQIGLNQLFAGSTPVPFPGTTNNSQPQQFRYLAKANRTYFDYVTANSAFNHGTDSNGVSFNQYLNNYTNAIASNTQPGAGQPIINLPVGTIMMKSAWRLLGPNDDPSRFHTTTVRFYEQNSSGQPVYYQEQNWGMAALHIVIKTPTAPAFIFATFEQADNLRLPNGKPLEDENGKIIAATPPTTATTPEFQHTDTATGTTTTVNGPFFTPSATDQRVFLRELAPSLPQPASGTGGIAINRRFEDIPKEIIDVNILVHRLISAYNQINNITNSPWSYYKLVNVQPQPLNPADEPKNPAQYFQANSVVETDYSLGQFSGILIQSGAQNGQTSNFSGGAAAYNVHLPQASGTGYHAFNSGGCMGCHGNAQAAGTDFSFTLSEGPVLAPDVPAPSVAAPTPAYLAKYIGRYGAGAPAKATQKTGPNTGKK